jgi:hypothetical protein
MSKVVVTLLGLNGASAHRVNLNLEGMPEDYDLLPDVVLHELEVPTVVRGVQINFVPESELVTSQAVGGAGGPSSVNPGTATDKAGDA